LDHDELGPKLRMNSEHVQNPEAKKHEVKCEYDSSCIETPTTDRNWNTPEYKTHDVRDDRDDVNEIPQITRIADKLVFELRRVLHCNLHNEYQLFSCKLLIQQVH